MKKLAEVGKNNLTMDKVREFLKKKVYEDRKYVIGLLVTSNSSDSCLDNFLNSLKICKSCQEKIDKEIKKYYSNLKVDFYDDISKIEHLFGQKGIYRGGHRFILEVPPKSFRNIGKNKKRLKGYREIIKFRMNQKNLKKFTKKDKLLLYLSFHIKDYFNSIDCDNLSKSIMDALEGILYVNDSQINILIAEKIKVNKKINEGVVISIQKLTN
ncbi:RusA family crossover junction endodeoxyribonuclease [Patescibacteria group bacterium]|nr:RusA family crossover junction endodeoxyribonuclease [Patescibacteria group bacterium]